METTELRALIKSFLESAKLAKKEMELRTIISKFESDFSKVNGDDLHVPGQGMAQNAIKAIKDATAAGANYGRVKRLMINNEQRKAK